MNDHQQAHIVFAGGGTAGHLFPGLAVAAALVEARMARRVSFAGCGQELQRRQVAQAGFEYLSLECEPWRRRWRHLPQFLSAHQRGRRQAAAFLSENRADLVIGLGGYASLPMARAAVRRTIPLILLEQNAVPGRATRWLARRAAGICLGMDEARARLPSTRAAIDFTGTPLRAGFAMTPQPARERLLVVLGGSGGARQLNEAVPRALALIAERLSGWRVLHQTGAADELRTHQRYAALGVDARTVSFIDDMPAVLARAGLVISRGGGTTLAELTACGAPAVICPYPWAADNHQRLNADALAHRGACRVFDFRDIAEPDVASKLAQLLAELVDCEAERLRLGNIIAKLAQPRATDHVVRMVRQILAVRPAYRGAVT